MTDNSKQIHDWQEKVRHSFEDEQHLYHYLFETMDNFLYRYLETTDDQNLKVKQYGDRVWGAESLESSMVNALKISNKDAHQGIMDLAKRVPKDNRPLVKYSLMAEIFELKTDKGHLELRGTVDWDFPEFKDPSKTVKKVVTFRYHELAQLRKELALKLEEVCSIFT